MFGMLGCNIKGKGKGKVGEIQVIHMVLVISHLLRSSKRVVGWPARLCWDLPCVLKDWGPLHTAEVGFGAELQMVNVVYWPRTPMDWFVPCPVENCKVFNWREFHHIWNHKDVQMHIYSLWLNITYSVCTNLKMYYVILLLKKLKSKFINIKIQSNLSQL